MELGLESVFAEYDKKLLEEYDIFARANSYEGSIIERLHYYGNRNLNQELVCIEYLSDCKGVPFYEAAVRYVKDWIEIELEIPDVKLSSDTGILEQQIKENIDNLHLEEDNPLSNIANLIRTNLLTNLVLNQDDISQNKVELMSLPSHRTLEEGSEYNQIAEEKDKAFFIAYLLEHFSDVTESKTEQKLAYELEYLLGGEDSDKENLENVLHKLLLIRMGANYAYLLTDETKKAEAGALAAVLCTLTAAQGMTDAVKQTLLLAWAYGESILDLRVLMKNEKVPILKTKETWQMQLSSLGKLGTDEDAKEEKGAEKGLGYTEYLAGLLLLENTENLCMRSLDLIELHTSVQVDQCMTKAVIQSENRLREGITDRFQTEFYYK